MKIKTEDDLLKIEVRQRIIAEIRGPENITRKRESKKRYECYKDGTKKYVIQSLSKDFYLS